MTQDNFNYKVTVAGPKEYPVEVHIGYLADEQKKLICGIPKAGVENCGWQFDGSEAGVGGDIAPSHINLIYVTYAEKKFYQLDAVLPKEKILEAFRKGFLIQSTNRDEKRVPLLEPSTYNTFTVAITRVLRQAG